MSFCQVEVVGLTWGDYNDDLFRFDSGSVDFIVGSDLFFDPEVFEPLVETVAYLLDQNPNAQVCWGGIGLPNSWRASVIAGHCTNW